MNRTIHNGFALLCDRDGRITTVLEGSEEAPALRSGSLFTTTLDPASLPKAGEFLAEISRNGSARGWELNVRSGETITTMHFAGQDSPDGMLVVAARRVSELAEAIERIAAEAQDPSAPTRDRGGDTESSGRLPRELDLYDELSRLNNELVTMQRELARKNAELQRFDKLKNQFLGIVAHDLRSPLSIIVAYSDFLLLEDQPPLSQRQARFVGSIRSSSAFMVELVNDLLDVSAIESGSLELDLAATDLVSVVEDTVAMHRVLGEKKQLGIELSIAGTIPDVVVDRRRIEQVLNNVLGNAIKFSPVGATIHVTIGVESDDVTISVANPGEGISAAALPTIFDPYVRSRTRGTAGEKGTGLGLAIARRIVEAHKGRITVDSAEGDGATFTISLPVRLPR
jgi:signal transduction histidine kinase